MPDPAYRVARDVALRVAGELELVPPFDVERIAARFVQLVVEPIPTRADVIVVHAEHAHELPRLVVDASLAPDGERRRFAVAHGLGHVLLGWHPLATPCDVSLRPQSLPVTVQELIEGEANAFARELLLPAAWIASFASFDSPAQLMRHVAERGGVSAMPAARAVALQLPAGYVWAVTDAWDRVVDAGRSPSTHVGPPQRGEELDAATWARHARERHRDEHGGYTITLWRFDDSAHAALPHDRTSRGVVSSIAADLDLDETATRELLARVEGLAGWANEQAGTSSLNGMQRALELRARSIPQLEVAAQHPAFETLLATKATELVAKRLAR